MQIDIEHATVLAHQLAMAAQPISFPAPSGDLAAIAQLRHTIELCSEVAAAQAQHARVIAEQSQEFIKQIAASDAQLGKDLAAF